MTANHVQKKNPAQQMQYQLPAQIITKAWIREGQHSAQMWPRVESWIQTQGGHYRRYHHTLLPMRKNGDACLFLSKTQVSLALRVNVRNED